jgi:hypothetical protein
VRIGGGLANRFRPPWRRLVLVVGIAAASAVSFGACGSSGTGPPAATAPDNILQGREISHYPAASAERTFLEYWSNLQFQSWADVAAYYDRAFRDFIGTATLIQAKKTGASAYPSLKPEIVRASTEQGITTVYYSLRLEDGSQELASTSWRRPAGNWQMIYDSRLDAELNQVAQERVQFAGDEPAPAAELLSAEAVRAGKVAANLQARFLQQELETSTP